MSTTLASATPAQLGDVLFALGNRTRLAVVVELAERGALSPGQMNVDVARSTLSQHLTILRRAGIIQQWAEGLRRPCQLLQEKLDEQYPGLLATVLNLAGRAA